MMLLGIHFPSDDSNQRDHAAVRNLTRHHTVHWLTAQGDEDEETAKIELHERLELVCTLWIGCGS